MSSQNTPLHCACLHGSVGAVRALVSLGDRVDRTLRNVDGLTPEEVICRYAGLPGYGPWCSSSGYPRSPPCLYPRRPAPSSCASSAPSPPPHPHAHAGMRTTWVKREDACLLPTRGTAQGRHAV